MNFIKKYFIKKKLSLIKLVVTDVDGVLTDGNLYIDSKGNETKRFNVKDGLGIKLLQEANIKIAVISGGKSESTIQRLKKLKIKYYFFEAKNKLEVLQDLKKVLDLKDFEVLYVGDDLNDLVLKEIVGILAAPSDAVKPVKNSANIILSSIGGDGAIRELSEMILEQKDFYKKIIKKGWIGKN
tara:strand:+ start:359 stop:907 length:549 start_codon:yes stop_codon:yes gene_type:complete